MRSAAPGKPPHWGSCSRAGASRAPGENSENGFRADPAPSPVNLVNGDRPSAMACAARPGAARAPRPSAMAGAARLGAARAGVARAGRGPAVGRRPVQEREDVASRTRRRSLSMQE
ncbi:hypothetical protein GQ55_2G436500 [Panicum hallii var. hallii]|uniref:Uncharacterized protein n=1 Tax=Panicum hallii var. hallii TaxID=1504633 RepID=A0A2T7EYP5_9POAL|nr:hypothetical protein GQ55_2G436500 [Panicum hallii var. hallii]